MAKVIEVFGTGCRTCRAVEDAIRAAAAKAGVEVDLRHVDDPVAIATRGVMRTPAVAVDGRVVHQGGAPDAVQVAHWVGRSA
jgi:small redox-active disulfide protein 2